MKVAFLFSGQGAQYPGMGKELYDYYSESKSVFEEASKILDWDIKEVCFQDSNGILNETRYTQSALFTTSIAAYKALLSKKIKPEAVLGFSLGEYSALVASGILDFEAALKLVEQRALFMDECAQKYQGGMAAVIGLDPEKIQQVCNTLYAENFIVTLANDNCPGQVVISGETVALQKATEKLKEAGARRVMPLKVSGAFHSMLMKEAATRLEEQLEEVHFNPPQLPIVSNVTAQFMNEDECKTNIPLQIINGVRFRESILYLIDQGFDTFIEVGVKKTLCSFVSKISKDVRTYHVEDLTSLNQVVEALGGERC